MSQNSAHRSSGGSGQQRPQWIYPPQSVLQELSSAKFVHPVYPLAKFCKIGRDKAGALKPDQSAFRDMLSAVHKRMQAGICAEWLRRRNSWVGILEASGLARRLILKTNTRTALWLSFPGPTEVGVCLHHVYGVPYLPGSSLKGLARSAMWRNVAPQSTDPPNDVTEIFGLGGDSGHIGLVDFLDGIPLGTSEILTLDVMTTHHAKYYAGNIPYPHDCEGPNPVLFPVIERGVEFEIALVCRHPDLATTVFGVTPQQILDRCEHYLCLGLQEMGLGAKTTSGFGRFTCTRAQPIQGKSQQETPKSAEAQAVSPCVPEPVKEEEPAKPQVLEIEAQVTLVDPSALKAEAVTDDGQKLEFTPVLFASKANIYRQEWRKQVGKTFVFVVKDGKVESLRKKEGQ